MGHFYIDSKTYRTKKVKAGTLKKGGRVIVVREDGAGSPYGDVQTIKNIVLNDNEVNLITNEQFMRE